MFNDHTFSDLLLDKDYKFKLNASVNDSETTPIISYKLLTGEKMPDGFTLFTDGTIVGTVQSLGTVSFVVEVSAPGYRNAHATITLNFSEYYAEEPTGTASTPIDFDKLNEEFSSQGCSNSIDYPIITMLVAVALIGTVCIIKIIINKEKK